VHVRAEESRKEGRREGGREGGRAYLRVIGTLLFDFLEEAFGLARHLPQEDGQLMRVA